MQGKILYTAGMTYPERIAPLALALLVLTGCAGEAGGTAGTSSSSRAPEMQTYRNDSYGIEMRIPSSWRASHESNNRQLTGADILFDTGVWGEHEGIRIDSTKKTSMQKLVSFMDAKKMRTFADVTIGGDPGKKVEMLGQEMTYFFVQHGGFVFTFQTEGRMVKAGTIDSVRFFDASSSSSR
jgi:hypothetical protein